MSFILRAGPDFVYIPAAWGLRAPGTCPFHDLTGLNCPFCGLTRGFVALAHGDLRRAIEFNAMAPAAFIFIASQIPYRALALWRGNEGRLGARLQKLALYLIGSALLIQWLFYLLARLL